MIEKKNRKCKNLRAMPLTWWVYEPATLSDSVRFQPGNDNRPICHFSINVHLGLSVRGKMFASRLLYPLRPKWILQWNNDVMTDRQQVLFLFGFLMVRSIWFVKSVNAWFDNHQLLGRDVWVFCVINLSQCYCFECKKYKLKSNRAWNTC